MTLYLIQPVPPAGGSSREKRNTPSDSRQPTNSKIRGLVLERIERGAGEVCAGLLLSAVSSRVMLDLLAVVALPVLAEELEKQRLEKQSVGRRLSHRRPKRRKGDADHLPRQ